MQKKSAPSKNRQSRDIKSKKQTSGTFHFQARRDDMFARELDLHEKGHNYIKEGGKVVDFGGQVTAVGKFSRNEKNELLNLVENMGAAQRKRDACDRILKVKTTSGGFVVYTAKPHLAVNIAKKLHAARKGGELNIVWSAGDQPVRALWISDIE